MMRDISRLLRAKSVAVIGGGTWCRNVIEQCEKMGFTGPIWPVHPTHSTIAGRAAYHSIDALPEGPDASFIGVNRKATVEVVEALARRGAGGAVCFASGFLEAADELADSAALQNMLCEAAANMPILGPNCYGFINAFDGLALWPDQHGAVRVDRGIALITQSSNIAINLTMQARGLPIGYVVTVGNQAQSTLTDIAETLLKDDRVTALGLYVEGISDIRGFERMAAAARRLGKPIVALKMGASEQARAASVSHTASLAGSDAGARALLKRLGIGRARSLDGLLEALKLLHVIGPLPSNRIASMSCSGGEASLMADATLAVNLHYPALSERQSAQLRAALGPKVALANPLDYHTYIWGDVEALAATFSAMMDADLALGLVILDFPRSDRCDPSAWMHVLDAIAQAQETSGKPIALLASLPETMPEQIAHRLIARGIVPFCGITAGLEGIALAAEIGSTPALGRDPVLVPRASGNPQVFSEADSKQALALYGVAVPKGQNAQTPEDAAHAAQVIGAPVALKGTGVAHKTEAGAVVLNLATPAEVVAAAKGMQTGSFYVEEMITDAVAELLVGVTHDPAHGYVLTIAAGGVLTEILEDKASLLVPAAEPDIRAALASLKISKLLDGYRGADAADLTAIVAAIQAVQRYVGQEHPEEVEINPLLCGPTRAVAADALIRKGTPSS